MTPNVEIDERKSAALAAANFAPPSGSRVLTGFVLARDSLRSSNVCQAALEAAAFGDRKYWPVFFLDGEEHKAKRQAISRYLTPKAMRTTYKEVMEETSDMLVDRLRADGSAVLDEIAFELTVAVAGRIVGLTESDNAKMAKRIEATLVSTRIPYLPKWARPLGKLRMAVVAIHFFLADVRPAINARRKQPQHDVISHLIEEGYPSRAILIECMTYALAGMVTTREFISMAAWHMLEKDDLRKAYLEAETHQQSAILEELLRLEPVAGLIEREVNLDTSFDSGSIEAGDHLAISIRDANVDPEVVGDCPMALDPNRAAKLRGANQHLSFGEGSHRCPGAQVAIAESRVFLDRLLRVPGLRMAKEPTMTWNAGIKSYELRGAILTCGSPG